MAEKPSPDATDKQHALACEQCLASSFCLPVGLNGKELEALDRIIHRRKVVQKSSHLFRVGDSLHSVYACRSGSFKLYKTDSEGQDNVLTFFLPGEIIGLDGIYQGVHQSNAVALETTSVCCIPFADLSKLAADFPMLQQQLLRLMSKELVYEYTTAGDYPADAKLAGFLLALSCRFSARGYSGKSFTLSMTRGDIANYLRMTPETVSRLFKRFVSKELITASKQEIHILEPLALKSVAGGAFGFGEVNKK